MLNINKIKQDFRIQKLLVIIFTAGFFLLFPHLQNKINNQIELINLRAFGSQAADTNIVIIKIDETTISSLNGWPIKRSYYALALKYLRELKAKKIGVEVLLANSSSALSIYNNLLVDQIKNRNNVVFASLLTNLKFEKDSYKSDSLILPEFNQTDLAIQTGHINYIKDFGLYLPTNVQIRNKLVHPFSVLLSDKKVTSDIKNFLVKLAKSWRQYKNIELIQFLKLYEQNPVELAFIKNKIVLIGVTDEMIAKNIEGVFDYRIPGVGFHAICIDNLLNDEIMNTKFLIIGSWLLFFIVILFVFISSGKRDLYFTFLLTAGLFFVGLISYHFGIILNYSIFIIPSLTLFASTLIISFYQQKSEFISTISENKILNQILLAKEQELKNLQNNVSEQDEKNQKIYEEKIQKLNSEIESLRKSQAESAEEFIAQSKNTYENFEGIIYKSAQMQKVVDLIKRVAKQNVTVLIQGETGTGKELVAHAIHNLSHRKNEKFIAINCAALTDSLLESELFGHVKGAFTNAIADRKGHFEAANKGTIFLDEIGETSERFQSKLLRVLQSGEIQKVGSTDNIFVDVRVIAATNKNLVELVKQKRFREDLFFRLNVIQIEIPPLKNRKEDISSLAEYFAQSENQEMKISNLVHQKLAEYEWKGNVRELQAVIKRAVIFASAEKRNLIKLSDLPENIKKLNKSDLETLILNSLREKKFSHTSVNETARELGGINRNVVSEHLRGLFFKSFVLSNFNFDQALYEISGSDEEEVLAKVKSKCETYIQNIQTDLEKLKTNNFDEVKLKFSSKYRNLPQKYHEYLDETIKFLLK